MKSQCLFRPAWLQQHPDKYLDKVLALSDKQISIQISGGLEREYEITVNSPDLECSDINNISSLFCDKKYIMAGNDFH